MPRSPQPHHGLHDVTRTIMSSRSCALVIVVVILLACVACEIGLTGVSGEKADPSGADPSLADRLGTSSSKQRVGEPATIDAASLYFENMDEHELATQYSMPPPVDTAIGAQVHALASRFVTTSFVDVVLVGFGGDGEAAVSLEAGELQRYLSHAGLGREQVKHVLRGSTHDLPMGTRYLYRIVHAHSSLRARIQMAVQTTVDHLVANNPFVLEAVEANRHASKPGTHKPPRLPVLRVPARVVHQLITEEYEAARMHQTAVYLLNLQPIVLRDETKPHRPAEVREGTQERVRLHYVYTQEAPERGENESGAPDESAVPPPHHCPTLHWESSLHRLSWFDLSAGPLAYGPSTEGEGVITDYSTPSIGRMLRDQTRHAQQVWESKTRGGSVNSEVPFRPSVELDSHYRHTLLSDLALLVHKTTRALLAPPTHRWPITHAEHVRVHLIFVHERRRHVEASNDPHAAHEDTATTDAASDERTQSRAWSAVEHELLGLALPGQTIEVRRHDLRFEECAQCVAAYAHSLRTSAASVQTDHSTPTSMHIHTHVRHHLDATELKDWLEHFDSSQWGLKDDSASSAGVRVMRVFIYDLAATQPVLLDRSHQSVAFDDMVVAVQSRAAPPRDVDFECAGRDLTMDPRDASRATLAAILTAGWGIVPAYQTWSPHRNDTERDFMFATGNTPFGHFSRETKLNFAIKDAVSEDSTREYTHQGSEGAR